MNIIRIYPFILCLLSTTAASANTPYQAHDEILSAVQRYLDTQLMSTQDIEIKTKIGHLDRRLKLARCENPLTSFSNHHTGFGSKISVGVKCSGKKPWSIYIPVTIQRLAKVFVSAQPIAKGNIISAQDIQEVLRDISTLRGRYLKSESTIVGKISKKSIPLGSVFNPRYLRLPIIIKRGDLVDILAESQGLIIRMSGKAVSNGSKGERINVKNLSSNRTIQAIVQHAGLVKITL